MASSARTLLSSSLPDSVPLDSVPPPADTTDERKKKAGELFSKKRLGEGELSLDKERLAEAISEERKRKARGEDSDTRIGKRAKGGQSATAEVTQEELGAFILDMVEMMLTFAAEAYRMNRRMTEDPMANYIDPEL